MENEKPMAHRLSQFAALARLRQPARSAPPRERPQPAQWQASATATQAFFPSSVLIQDGLAQRRERAF
ncbi:MAG TPA: hypothetical protein VND64_26015 [Pirellulales bacterium]|nr:hypothetical protein [Pirellulales bacterium]